MLDQLFGSKTRVQILSLFLKYPGKKFYSQEVTSLTHLDPANAFRELRRLVDAQVLQSEKQGNKPFYSINTTHPSYQGLSLLFNTGRRQRFLPADVGIPEQEQKELKGQEWYHQRFDGSPLYILAIGEAEVRQEVRKPQGTEANVRVCFFSHGTADWYLNMDDIKRGAAKISDLAKNDPTISKQLLKSWTTDEQALEHFFWTEFPTYQVHQLSDDDLLDLWDTYYEKGVKRFTSSSIIDHFALGTDEYIRSLLRKEVYAHAVELSSSEFTNIFAIATAPVHQSFINEAEIDLLRIATAKSKESVDSYQQRYFWTSNNYTDAHVLSADHFREQIQNWKKGSKDLFKELNRLIETPKLNKENKKKLFAKYKFSQELKTLIQISEDFSWWQDERKKATMLNIHMGVLLAQEIGQRKGYTLDELRYCSAAEIQAILNGTGPTAQALRERRESCVFVMTKEGLYIETGKAVEQIRSLMLGEQKTESADDVRGLSACLGRAIGTVKVVKSVKEMGKVQKGDILVAVMTRPDYVPAMRLAAAIVTNEGGITSHAAIVSRELGIPCVIGTKIATEVFRDGDLIEVNANHSWVRKIKQ